jgi:alpha-L-fucosidase 2
VTHGEMNVRFRRTSSRIEIHKVIQQIFGHTGMKLGGNSAQWANYPGTMALLSFLTE